IYYTLHTYKYYTLCFLFHSHRSLLDLHSFPTRRSSDLNAIGYWRQYESDRDMQISAQLAQMRAPPVLASGGGRRAARPDRGDHLDRKSTRLNSSHLVISYAVFCLKKKKK